MSTNQFNDPYRGAQDPYAAPQQQFVPPQPVSQHAAPSFQPAAPGMPPQQQFVVAKPTSGWAIWGLVLGLVSIFGPFGTLGILSFLAPFGLWTSIVGIRRTGANGPNSGRGIAIGGLITSIIGGFIMIATLIWYGFIVYAVFFYQPPTY